MKKLLALLLFPVLASAQGGGIYTSGGGSGGGVTPGTYVEVTPTGQQNVSTSGGATPWTVGDALTGVGFCWVLDDAGPCPGSLGYYRLSTAVGFDVYGTNIVMRSSGSSATIQEETAHGVINLKTHDGTATRTVTLGDNTLTFPVASTISTGGSQLTVTAGSLALNSTPVLTSSVVHFDANGVELEGFTADANENVLSAAIADYQTDRLTGIADLNGLLAPFHAYTLNVQAAQNTAGKTFNVQGGDAADFAFISTGLVGASDSDGVWLSFTTTGGGADVEGIQSAGGAFYLTERQWAPTFFSRVKTSSAITTMRVWVGLFASDPSASATPSVALAGFRYDTTADGTAFWRACSNSGTDGVLNCSTTTVPVATDTAYSMWIAVGGSEVFWRVVANSAADAGILTTDLPPSATDLGVNASITELAAAARRLYWGRFAIAMQ